MRKKAITRNKRINTYRYKPMPKVFIFNLFNNKLSIGLWEAEYYNSYFPKLGYINCYSYLKLGLHFKGYLFEVCFNKFDLRPYFL